MIFIDDDGIPGQSFASLPIARVPIVSPTSSPVRGYAPLRMTFSAYLLLLLPSDRAAVGREGHP